MSCISGNRGGNVRVLFLLTGLIVLLSGPVSAQTDTAVDGGAGADTAAPGDDRSPSAEDRTVVVDTVIEAAGGRVRIDIEKTSSDLLRVGESLVVDADEIVKGDAVVIGGNLDVYGRVNGDAVVVGGTLHLHDGCRVFGEAVAVAGRVVRDDGALVDGEQVSIGSGFEKILPWGWSHRSQSPGRTVWLAFRKAILRLFLTLFAVLIFVDLFPRPTARVANKIQEDYFRSGLAGMLAIILTPLSILVLVISIIGILLLPFLGMLIGIGFVWGWVAVSLVAGRTLGARFFGGVSTPRWQALIGAFLLYVTCLVGEVVLGLGGSFSFVGWTLLIAGKVITTVALLIGFGAVLMTRFGRRGNDGTAMEKPAIPGEITPAVPEG